MAYDVEEAEQAMLVWFGRVSHPEPERDRDDSPVFRRHPSFGLAGPMQYLDSTLVLHGDPCVTPWRAPDSSPALDTAASFALDAFKRGHWADRFPQSQMYESIARQEARRDEFLDHRGLLRGDEE